MFFKKKEAEYEIYSRDGSDEPTRDDKFVERLKYVWKLIVLSCSTLINAVGGKLGKGKADYYEEGSEDGHDVSPVMKKLAICNIVFAIYGFISGIFIQNYCQYLCRSFAAFACGMKLTSPNIISSPLTIIMDIVLIFVCYLSVVVVAGCIYFLFKTFLFHDDDEEEFKELLQVAFMYAMMLIVLTGIVCLIIPFNFYIH